MKIDVVIGNPPYQRNSTRGTQGGVSIYNEFMQISEKVRCKYSSMIVPSRWLCNAGSRGIDDEWIKTELNCNKYKHIVFRRK